MHESLAYIFPVLRYFALFASRCLIGRGNYGNLSIPDIIILHHGLYGDNSFSMGCIIAKRLSLNRTKGPIFGGIYATRLAAHFNIPIRHFEKEEKSLLLPLEHCVGFPRRGRDDAAK